MLHFIVPAWAKGGLAGMMRQIIKANARPRLSLRRIKVRFFIDLSPSSKRKGAAKESH